MKSDVRAKASSKSRSLWTTPAAGGESLRPAEAAGLARLWDYVKQHGTAQPRCDHRTADGILLGRWVSNRRNHRGAHPELDRLLESLPGWTWSVPERGFEEQLSRYKEVVEAGKLSRHKALRMWALSQRRRVREGRVSADRLERLREAGIV
jgi:hypothetical protein